jgi:hypothetical protein
MAVLYSSTVRNNRMQQVLDAIDANASPAYLEICSAAYAAVLATITLADPSFTRSNDVLTMAGVPKSDTSADNTGTAAIARIKDGGGTVIIQGLTVGTGSENIVLNSTSITSGQQVSITSATITHATGI